MKILISRKLKKQLQASLNQSQQILLDPEKPKLQTVQEISEENELTMQNHEDDQDLRYQSSRFIQFYPSKKDLKNHKTETEFQISSEPQFDLPPTNRGLLKHEHFTPISRKIDLQNIPQSRKISQDFMHYITPRSTRKVWDEQTMNNLSPRFRRVVDEQTNNLPPQSRKASGEQIHNLSPRSRKISDEQTIQNLTPRSGKVSAEHLPILSSRSRKGSNEQIPNLSPRSKRVSSECIQNLTPRQNLNSQSDVENSGSNILKSYINRFRGDQIIVESFESSQVHMEIPEEDKDQQVESRYQPQHKYIIESDQQSNTYKSLGTFQVDYNKLNFEIRKQRKRKTIEGAKVIEVALYKKNSNSCESINLEDNL